MYYRVWEPDASSTFLCILVFLLFFTKLALLAADEDVLIGAAWHDIVGHNELRVLLCSHAQVPELAVGLVELLESRLRFHHKITNKRANLHGWEVLWEKLDWDSIKVYKNVANGAWLGH